MPEVCAFPFCKSNSVTGPYCIGHAKMMGTEKINEPAKKISIKSVKRKVDDKLYKKILKEVLDKNPECKIKSPVCTGKAQGFDHKQKTSPNNRLNRSNLVPACNACNLYKEVNPVWAEQNGHSVSRFKK